MRSGNPHFSEFPEVRNAAGVFLLGHRRESVTIRYAENVLGRPRELPSLPATFQTWSAAGYVLTVTSRIIVMSPRFILQGYRRER